MVNALARFHSASCAQSSGCATRHRRSRSGTAERSCERIVSWSGAIVSAHAPPSIHRVTTAWPDVLELRRAWPLDHGAGHGEREGKESSFA